MLRNCAIILMCLAAWLHATAAYAAQSLSFIRDAEIEQTLKTYGEPIFRAAGLVPENVHIFIVQSDDINAFVAGGQNIFIYTGLIQAMETPDMLIGVLAHETAHIAGGHLARGTEQLKNAQIGTIIGFVLGGLAAAAGAGDAGTAVMSGSSHVFQRGMLAFTRSNEQSADQAALNYLDTLGISAEGMMKTFQLLKRKERRQFGDIDPYAVTHPLSSERVVFLKEHLARAKIPTGHYPKPYLAMHQRMLAKLHGFMELPPKTFARYPDRDTSVAARMARAVAWHKKSEFTRAMAAMDDLLQELPKDGFIQELKGQILFENGRLEEAEHAYLGANALAPEQPLIMASLAEVYINQNTPQTLPKARDLLERAVEKDDTDGRYWRLLGIAYGKMNQLDLSHLALAEEAALQQNADDIERNVNQALVTMPEHSPHRLRAEDLKRLAVEIREKK